MPEAPDPDADITLWSAQHKSVLDTLQSSKYVASYDYVPSTRKERTLWMSEQMAKRGNPTGINAPIWGFSDFPFPKSHVIWGSSLTDDHVLMELSVPRSRVLISFHMPWMARLGHTMKHTFLYTSRNEREADNYRVPPEEQCIASWQRIFDLDLVEKNDLEWTSQNNSDDPFSSKDQRRLQATLPYILPDDLVAMRTEW